MVPDGTTESCIGVLQQTTSDFSLPESKSVFIPQTIDSKIFSFCTKNILTNTEKSLVLKYIFLNFKTHD